MNKIRLKSLFIAVMFLTSSVFANAKVVEGSDVSHHISERDRVEKTLADWIVAFNNKDSKALFELYDPQSTYMSPDSPILRGIEQIKPFYEEFFSLINGTLKYKQEVISVDGNMAVIVLKFYIDPFVKNEADQPFAGRAMLVFRKSEDNKWLLLFDMDNTPPDVSARDFD